MIHALSQLLQPLALIQTVGLLGVIVIIFAESGLLIGFFLPGDSLLFTAGFLAGQHFFNIFLLVAGCAVAAIVGDSVGYWFGNRVGSKIFSRENSFFFNKKHLERSRQFYEKYGPKTVVLSRFMPIVRTFAPVLAGVGKMNYRTFLSFNIIGGLLWTIGIAGLGYLLGNAVPNIDSYILPIILVIVFVSFLPMVRELYLARQAKPAQSKSTLEIPRKKD